MGAGLACLIAVSAMLAYRDWPGTEAGRPDGHLIVRVPDGKVDGRSSTGPATAAELVAATGATGATPPRTRARGDAPSSTDRAGGPSRPRPTSPQTPVSGGTPVAGAPAAPATPVASAPARGGSSGGGGGGSGGGGGGGDVTAPVPVPPAVQQPVDQVLDTVEDTAGTMDGVVEDVPVAGDAVGALLP